MREELFQFGNRASVTDFGCAGADFLTALPSALAVALLFVFLSVMGSCAGGRKRWAAADVISGWGILAIIFTLGGIFLPPALSAIAFGLIFLTFLVIRRRLKERDYQLCPPWFLIAIALQLGVLTLINLAGITTWDEVATWSPSAIYLWRHDTFPHLDYDPSFSRWPAYPYGMAYLGYAASFIYNSFITQSGSMATWLLFTCFAYALSETYLRPTKQKITLITKLAWLTFAILLCTIFNPGFNASFSVSGASDAPTAVVVGFLGLLFVQLHAALATKDKERIESIATQLALAAAVLMVLRQVNIVLLVILSFGFLVLAIKDKFLKQATSVLGLALLPAIILRIVWQYYTNNHLPGGAVGIMPFDQWRWNLLPDLLQAMSKDAAEKWGFYLLMLVTSSAGLVGFFRTSNPTRALNFITATAFFGYFAFLLLAYMACDFVERDIKRASSFYRYSSHVGMLGIASLWFMLRPWLEQRMKSGYLIALTMFSLLVTPAIYLMRPDWVVRHSRPEYCASRDFGKQIATALPPHSKMITFDLDGNGFQAYITNYELALDDLRRQQQSRIVEDKAFYDNKLVTDLLALTKKDPGINAIHVAPAKSGSIDADLRAFLKLSEDSKGGLFIRNGTNWEKLSEASSLAPVSPPNATTPRPAIK